MSVLTRDELTAELKEMFPNMLLRTTEEFNSIGGGVWTSGEDGIDGPIMNHLPLFDYYTQDGGSNFYSFGVNNTFYEFLEERGWYAEFNDPGTVMLWEI